MTSALLPPKKFLSEIRKIVKDAPTVLQRGDIYRLMNMPSGLAEKTFQTVWLTVGILFFLFGGIMDGSEKNANFFLAFFSLTNLLWAIFGGVILGIIAVFCLSRLYKRKPRRQKGDKIKTTFKKGLFGLYLGKSTGSLAKLFHIASIAPAQNIFLTLQDAAQNILTLGAIGSGKTTRVMRPLLLQLFNQDCGGLIFDIKGDFKETAEKFAAITKKPLKVIGVSQSRINLLAGLSPEIAASFLKSGFLLNSQGKLDGFWIQTASELCRNALGVLSYLPKNYNLESLYAYLFDKDFKDKIDGKIYKIASKLEAQKVRILKSYCRYEEAIFSTFDEKVKSGVRATVAQVLSPFSHPELIDAFCSSDDVALNINDVLDGTVYLVDLPLAKWGLGGKVIYTFIKLRFFNLMQNRQTHTEWNQSRPVFFMCDEYQEIVSANKDGLSDLNFWDKSRTSNTIGIISGQSVSSFIAAIGDRHLTDALLQNFRQKICFKTEDTMTLRLLNEIAGMAMTLKARESIKGGFSSHSTTTYSEQKESVVDAQLMRKILPNQGVALLSINSHNMDDVLEMIPVSV